MRNNCLKTPHGDDIGDDAIGRRYRWCAECGGEWLLSPDDDTAADAERYARLVGDELDAAANEPPIE